MQETLEEAKRYEMQHLALINAKDDMKRTFEHHKDRKPDEDITLLYPFPESAVSMTSPSYDSQLTYYSASLITIFKSIAESLDWVNTSVVSGTQKEYDTQAEATEQTEEILDNGDIVKTFSKPSHELPTVELKVLIAMEDYNQEELDNILVDFE